MTEVPYPKFVNSLIIGIVPIWRIVQIISIKFTHTLANIHCEYFGRKTGYNTIFSESKTEMSIEIA